MAVREIYDSGPFRRDLKRARKRGKDLSTLGRIIDLLARNKPLPERCRPHKLLGQYSGLWECHIEPDWLLVWEAGEDYVQLVRTGTHADLFR